MSAALSVATTAVASLGFVPTRREELCPISVLWGIVCCSVGEIMIYSDKSCVVLVAQYGWVYTIYLFIGGCVQFVSLSLNLSVSLNRPPEPLLISFIIIISPSLYKCLFLLQLFSCLK